MAIKALKTYPQRH